MFPMLLARGPVGNRTPDVYKCGNCKNKGNITAKFPWTGFIHGQAASYVDKLVSFPNLTDF